MTTISLINSQINRDHCAGEYLRMATEIANANGIDKDFSKGGGWTMDYNSFKVSAYAKNWEDYQVDCYMDFIAHTITFTIH